MKCLYCHNRDTWSINDGTKYTIEDVTSKIDSLKGFYRSGDGGITASGGEPLLQSDFVLELFKSVHDFGLTTALDTSGHVELTDSVKRVLSNTDYLLLDVKSLDENIHKSLVGVNRALVSIFFNYISNLDCKIWLRYVYVPTYTDRAQDLIKLVDFINIHKNIERIDILPYHDLGKGKWEAMGYKYPLENLQLPNKDKVKKFKSYIKESTSVIVK